MSSSRSWDVDDALGRPGSFLDGDGVGLDGGDQVIQATEGLPALGVDGLIDDVEATHDAGISGRMARSLVYAPQVRLVSLPLAYLSLSEHLRPTRP